MRTQDAVRKRSRAGGRIASAIFAVALGLGGTVIVAQPAAAATCTSFGRDGAAGNYLVGSCTGSGDGRFTVKWSCSQWETPKTKSFGGGGFGQSFRFKACDRRVYSASVYG